MKICNRLIFQFDHNKYTHAHIHGCAHARFDFDDRHFNCFISSHFGCYWSRSFLFFCARVYVSQIIHASFSVKYESFFFFFHWIGANWSRAIDSIILFSTLFFTPTENIEHLCEVESIRHFLHQNSNVFIDFLLCFENGCRRVMKNRFSFFTLLFARVQTLKFGSSNALKFDVENWSQTIQL